MEPRFELWCVKVPLRRPYTIAYETCSEVEMAFVRFTRGKYAGYGCASPLPEVTGESFADCRAALEAAQLDSMAAQPLLARAPAARAALDIARHDLDAKLAGKPLVELYGRAHEQLLTSITIGIKDTLAEVLDEADEYIGRGFPLLKIKIGSDLEQDIERLAKLREHCGADVRLCVDANEGCTSAELPALCAAAQRLGIEFIEQPLPRAQSRMRHSTSAVPIALDESLLSPADARQLAAEKACDIFNIKLMKCGGITAALDIARIAAPHDIGLMWGCSDESVISIAAALHAAYSCPATRVLDLDGHLDLARDPARGGFTIRDGIMQPNGQPGLGIDWKGF
jgi:L-alanine-DL-glutamate epimerase-like enolase superfamily enzyme